MKDFQSIIDKYAERVDKRTSIFEIEIKGQADHSLTVSGRLLDASQLDDLERLFPDHSLDTTSVRILNHSPRRAVHVATNLTGLYEQPTFGLPLSSELYFGTKLEILDEEKNWALTRQPDGYLGWVYRSYLSEGIAPQATHIVIVPVVELRASPNESSEIITRIVSGTGVVVEETQEKWACVSANRSGWMPSSYLRALKELSDTLEKKRASIITDAKRMIGIPYLWGGTSGNGIDCSGLARLLHRWVGVDIPRDADMQHADARPVEPPFEIGDLLFFAEKDSRRKITHVGVSLGGWTMIHSSRMNNGVYINNVQQSPPLMNNYVRAGSFLRQL